MADAVLAGLRSGRLLTVRGGMDPYVSRGPSPSPLGLSGLQNGQYSGIGIHQSHRAGQRLGITPLRRVWSAEWLAVDRPL